MLLGAWQWQVSDRYVNHHGRLASSASGISLSRSIGSSALMPTAPNDSANLTRSGFSKSVSYVPSNISSRSRATLP